MCIPTIPSTTISPSVHIGHTHTHTGENRDTHLLAPGFLVVRQPLGAWSARSARSADPTTSAVPGTRPASPSTIVTPLPSHPPSHHPLSHLPCPSISPTWRHKQTHIHHTPSYVVPQALSQSLRFCFGAAHRQRHCHLNLQVYVLNSYSMLVVKSTTRSRAG